MLHAPKKSLQEQLACELCLKIETEGSKKLRHDAGTGEAATIMSFVADWLREQEALEQNGKIQRQRQRHAEREREYRKKRTPEQRAAFYLKVVRPWKRGRGKLAVNLQNRIHKLITLAGVPQFGTVTELLGCKIREVRSHLASQFKPGMSWDNYGPEWEIDHILPCSGFDLADPMQQQACFHFSNLQPLFKPDHNRKTQRDSQS